MVRKCHPYTHTNHYEGLAGTSRPLSKLKPTDGKKERNRKKDRKLENNKTITKAYLPLSETLIKTNFLLAQKKRGRKRPPRTRSEEIRQKKSPV